MKKRILAILVVILVVFGVISIVPYPQKVQKTLYGTETFSGEDATLSVDVTYLKYLFRQDKIYLNVTASCENKTVHYHKDFLPYIGYWPLNEDSEALHYFVGWYLNTNVVGDFRLESLKAYLSKDFSKLLLYHEPSETAENSVPKQYICSVEKNKTAETKEFFGPYVK